MTNFSDYLNHLYTFLDVSLVAREIMMKALYFLLVIATLQLSFDETLSHFDLNGHVDLQGNSAFASVNGNIQKCHDHLWVVSSIPDLGLCKEQPLVRCVLPMHIVHPDYTLTIWQPPKHDLI